MCLASLHVLTCQILYIAMSEKLPVPRFESVSTVLSRLRIWLVLLERLRQNVHVTFFSEHDISGNGLELCEWMAVVHSSTVLLCTTAIHSHTLN